MPTTTALKVLTYHNFLQCTPHDALITKNLKLKILPQKKTNLKTHPKSIQIEYKYILLFV